MSTDVDEPIPLTAWIRGTLTIHFTGGTVVKHRTTLLDAHTFEQMMNKKRSSDALDWSATEWKQWRAKKVLFSTFEHDEDYGWRLTPEDRTQLNKNGHHHGILATLLNHWRNADLEPSYNAVAMHLLFQNAKEHDLASFAHLADILEGTQGANRIRTAIDDLATTDTDIKTTGEPTTTSTPARPDADTGKTSKPDQCANLNPTPTRQPSPTGSEEP